MKIGISGASGHLGRAVSKRLSEFSGRETVVGISRSPQAVECADEARFGDYDDRDGLQDAYLGLDKLLVIPTLDLGPGARARQLVNAIDAALSAGVGHIVLVSDVGTREEPEPLIGAASWVAEQHLISSVARWTILRANYFMESFAQEAVLSAATGRMPEIGEGRVGYVSRDDVAASAAGILRAPGHSGIIYNATGPEALSLADRVRLIEEVSGQRVEVVLSSPEGLWEQLGLLKIPEEYFGLVTYIKQKTANGGYDIVTGDVEALSGRPPIALGDVVRRHFIRDSISIIA